MRHFTAYLLLFSCSLLHAYDLVVDGVYISIIGPRFAYVTNAGLDSATPCYSGDIVVPQQVTYNGRVYNISSVGDNAFVGCDELTSVQLPPTVTAVSACAFLGCTALRSVNMPKGMLTVTNAAFSACTSLQHISLPRHQESVNDMTFYCCASLTSLVLPHRIRTIQSTAMQHLPSLTDLYCFASEPPVAEVGAFSLADQQKCTLHVPRETIGKYREAPVWCDFCEIVPLQDSEYEEQGYLRGDINDDGEVDGRDLALLRLIIVSLPDDSAVRWAADINEDGIVNAKDYVLLANVCGSGN